MFEADGSDRNVFALKVPSLSGLTETAPGSQIVPELTPLPSEFVLRKRLPSAFFGTSLAAWYTSAGVDTVLVAGCTTSGCVRASVTDAMSSGFRPIVVTDCVGDRALGPHAANLFDLGQKSADLMSCADVLTLLAKLGAADAARQPPR